MQILLRIVELKNKIEIIGDKIYHYGNLARLRCPVIKSDGMGAAELGFLD